mmetsp:Transcript_13356/g.17837  ORF Transcript_13356/g.17837 Transcript_13356/m.17837 type:complete len:497 (+) Transcript_13356:1-1491(+)
MRRCNRKVLRGRGFSSDGGIRARFAPSPTGSLHLGGARTALLNYLFVRKAKLKNHQASLVLRIEDTDITRSRADSAESLFDELRWLGLEWDEGPYYSSQRNYDEAFNTLINNGAAYRDFGSEEDWRSLSKREEAKARYDNGEPFAIRFKAPDSNASYSIPDAIRGRIEWKDLRLAIPTDFVLARSNGRPLYNACAAIDDAEMRITHVVRGEEHMANTLRQALILTALGHDLPLYAHCGLLIDKIYRKKLSKRDETGHNYSIAAMRNVGIRPSALATYLATVGGGVVLSNDFFQFIDENEILDFIAQHFELDRVTAAATVHDPEKLNWIDAHIFHKLHVTSRKEAVRKCFEDFGYIQLSEDMLNFITTTLVGQDIIQCNVLAHRVHTSLKYDLEAILETIDQQGPQFRLLLRNLADHLLESAISTWQERLNDAVACYSNGTSKRKIFSALRLLLTSSRSGFALDKHATLIDLASVNSSTVLSTRSRMKLISDALRSP